MIGKRKKQTRKAKKQDFTSCPAGKKIPQVRDKSKVADRHQPNWLIDRHAHAAGWGKKLEKASAT